MGAMLVVTTWTLNLKITPRHLQHDWHHVGRYHVDIIPEDYYATFQHYGRHVGSYHVDIKPEDYFMSVVTTLHFPALAPSKSHVGSYSNLDMKLRRGI
jgi:hypothetical protein